MVNIRKDGLTSAVVIVCSTWVIDLLLVANLFSPVVTSSAYEDKALHSTVQVQSTYYPRFPIHPQKDEKTVNDCD